MFIETTEQNHRQTVYIRADRVSGMKVWPIPHSDETRTEVFLAGAPETVMVADSAEALMQRIREELDLSR